MHFLPFFLLLGVPSLLILCLQFIMTQLNGSNGAATNGSVVIDPQVAIAPSAPELLPGLLKDVERYSQAIAKGDPNARLKLVDAAWSLSQAMETPQETMLRYSWAQVGQSRDMHRGSKR